MGVQKYKRPITAPSFSFTAANPTNAVASGSVIDVAAEPTATSGRFNTIKAESYLAPAAKAAAGGCYSVRGLVGVKTGKTYAPSGIVFLAGVQGKLDPAGAVGDGTGTQIYACGVLAQVNAGAGSFGAETQVYGLWVDNQFTGNPTLYHLCNLTNNGGNVTNLFKIYGNDKVAHFADIEKAGGGMVVAITGNATKMDKALKIKIEGADYYIPCQNATS